MLRPPSLPPKGLAAITQFVERQPQAFGNLARALSQDYKTVCENADAELDAALIARVAQAIGVGG
jgi:hypothetical protein